MFGRVTILKVGSEMDVLGLRVHFVGIRGEEMKNMESYVQDTCAGMHGKTKYPQKRNTLIPPELRFENCPYQSC